MKIKSSCLLCNGIISGNGIISAAPGIFQPPFSFLAENFCLGRDEIICKDCVLKLGFIKTHKLISRGQDFSYIREDESKKKKEGDIKPNKGLDLEGTSEAEVGRVAFEEVLYLAPYGGYIKELVHEFKLGKNIDLKVPLGRFLGLRILMEEERKLHREENKLKLLNYVFLTPFKTIKDYFISGQANSSAYYYDIVTYIPLHENRLYERGFDQAELLAEEVSRVTGASFMNLLVRTEDTIPQGQLSKKERLINLRGKFEFNSRVAKESIKGKRVILVDDIFTTGASTSEGARVLLEEGAGSVSVLVLCR